MRKKIKNIFLYGVLPLTSVVLMAVAFNKFNAKLCSKVTVEIENQAENYFLDVDNVKTLLGADQFLVGSRLENIRLSALEYTLYQTGFVAQADAWFRNGGELCVKVKLKRPIARIMNNKGKSFYVDENLKKMPASKGFAARTLLVSGNFNENFSQKDTLSDTCLVKLLPMLQYIDGNEFWRAQISEIVMNSPDDYTLYPQVGSLKVEFGTPVGYETKLNNLFNFYTSVLDKTGWSYYKSVSLRFDKQIVAVKNAPPRFAQN